LRALLRVIGIAALSLTAASAEVDHDPALLAQLQMIFPAAASFSAKSGTPPVYRALGHAAAGADGELLGFAFWTTEIEPLERGFDGPIKMLVGLDMTGRITGIIVTEHREPYGYFSVELPEFADQFAKKSIRDPFKVGADVDAITRATISVTSASRAVRNASRKVARAYLAPPPAASSTAQ
jgi:transcriptional regulator of nitric oxide reductase